MSVLRRAGALAWGALLLELALYRSLARWLARRPDVPGGTTGIGYAQLVAPMLWLWIFGSAVEMVAFDLILQRWWTPLRIPVLALSAWGLLWMLGLMASYRVRPHLLDDEVLRLRAGARTEVTVPLEAVDRVMLTEADAPGMRSVKLLDDHLAVTATGRTNLRLQLAEGTTLRTPRGELTVPQVATWVDEPRAAAALIRRRLAAPSR